MARLRRAVLLRDPVFEPSASPPTWKECMRFDECGVVPANFKPEALTIPGACRSALRFYRTPGTSSHLLFLIAPIAHSDASTIRLRGARIGTDRRLGTAITAIRGETEHFPQDRSVFVHRVFSLVIGERSFTEHIALQKCTSSKVSFRKRSGYVTINALGGS